MGWTGRGFQFADAKHSLTRARLATGERQMQDFQYFVIISTGPFVDGYLTILLNHKILHIRVLAISERRHA
jgi:hypothetical protein